MAAGIWWGRLLGTGRRRASRIQAKSAPIDPLEAVYRQLAENIPQVFWMADCSEERLIYVSPAMHDLWLVEPQVIINDPGQWFASIHPADRSSAELKLSSMLSGSANCCEYRIIRPDGEIRAVRNRSFRVADSSGAVTRIAGIIEDVTSEREAQRALRESRDELVRHVNELKLENRERRRAETELRAAKELAEAGNRAKSQFLRNISHELRTPLNGIIGMLQIAIDPEDSDDERRSLQSAAQSAEHLLAIVDDILEFSESEAGRLDIRKEPFEVRRCVRDVVRRVAPQVFEKNLELAYFVSTEVPQVIVGDGKRVARILSHLFSNAVKFSNAGSVCLEVTRTERAGNASGLRFAVTDTGIGISPESRDAIFEAFTQVDGSLTRSYGGLGLGLSICSRLVALMGGEMSLESTPGEGSRFGFTIPLSAGTLLPDRAIREFSDAMPVLIVCSDSAPRSVAERALRDAGLAVRCCSDPNEALQQIEEAGERFAAILLAGRLADPDFFDVAKRLCERPGISQKLFLLLDAQDEYEQHSRLKELRVAGHFVQPVDFDEVRTAIRKLHPASGFHLNKPTVLGSKPVPVLAALRVLLVEDNPINQTVLKRMLQKQGHSVVTADNGRIALDTLDNLKWNIDLVLMDMQMPELDGYETTARIRAIERERGGHLPIIAATAHAMAGDAERCLNAGMDGYITKPIQMDVLARAILNVSGLLPSGLTQGRKVS